MVTIWKWVELAEGFPVLVFFVVQKNIYIDVKCHKNMFAKHQVYGISFKIFSQK